MHKKCMEVWLLSSGACPVCEVETSLESLFGGIRQKNSFEMTPKIIGQLTDSNLVI